MITKKEINIIDRNYFNIINYNPFVIYIQSKNTGHFWGLHLVSYSHFRNFKILHKHNYRDEYHKHRDARSIQVAIKHIMDHDTFQLNGRKF